MTHRKCTKRCVDVRPCHREGPYDGGRMVQHTGSIDAVCDVCGFWRPVRALIFTRHKGRTSMKWVSLSHDDEL